MRSIFRRALCALLCLCLLTPALSLAEGDATGVRFDLALSMDASAFSQEQQTTLQGIAELLNILTVQGTLDQAYTGCFDLNADILLNGQEKTRTPVRIYGTESHWGVESSLLGDEMLMINMIAMLEFSMKAYFHLNIPVQRYTLLMSPYIHQSAFEALGSAFSSVMLTEEGERTIPREDVLALAEQLAEIASGDRAFIYWVKALALEAGYDETIMEAIETLPEWLEGFMGEDGVTISVMGATETWRTGETTLFTRTVEDSVTAWSITLPTTTNGYTLNVYYNGQPNSDHVLQVSVTDEYEDLLIDCTVKAANIPDLTSEVPISNPFSLEYQCMGYAMEEEIHLLFQGEGADGQFSLSMLNTETLQPQLTLSGALEAYTPAAVPEFTDGQMVAGVNLLSINDTTLTQLLRNVASPMLKGMIPLLVNMPAASVQSILDLLTDSGILGLVASGGASDFGEEYFDEEYDEAEEFYDDEEFYDGEEYYEEYDEDTFTGREE